MIMAVITSLAFDTAEDREPVLVADVLRHLSRMSWEMRPPDVLNGTRTLPPLQGKPQVKAGFVGYHGPGSCV